MDLLDGQGQMVWKNIFVLAVHSVVWSLVFACISGKNRSKSKILLEDDGFKNPYEKQANDKCDYGTRQCR